MSVNFDENVLNLDCEAETSRICDFIEQQMLRMRRQGAVIGMSGGVDSALCALLCSRALGSDRVFVLILPEKESNPQSKVLALKQAQESELKNRGYRHYTHTGSFRILSEKRRHN